MNRLSNRKGILPAFLVVLLLVFGPYGDSRVAAIERDTYRSLKEFNEILDIIQKNYVEEVKTKTLLEGAINGMMKELDPHSAYMSPDMYKDLEVETRGSFGGLGIEIGILKDILTVVSPIEDTPAFEAGIKAGDQIVKIDGQWTKDMTITDAVKKLRGPKDTKVTITIMREGFTAPKDVTITRAIIAVKSVKTKLFEDAYGYVRITHFQEKTGEELSKGLKDLVKKAHPLKGLILDLRNNPGGLLPQAIEVSDAFLKSGVIVSTQGRMKSMESRFIAHDDKNEPTCPMVVLVNEGSASASEIVAGALQDNGRAVILGAQTFGKGSVQTVIPLEDGAALKLTTQRYYTPKGRSIQAEGITPDIVVKLTRPSDGKDIMEGMLREKDLEGHIKGTNDNSKKENGKKEEIKEDTPKKEIKKDEIRNEGITKEPDLGLDNQLKSALDILKSWDVFRKNIKS